MFNLKAIRKALFFTGLIAISSTAIAQDEVTVALARSTITPAEETFTIAVPQQLGYFDDENIKVSIITTNGSTAALQAVASGSANVAYTSSANIAAAVEKGMPIKAFAGITVQWPYFIGVPKGSDIKTLQDLKGKRIGVISMASASYADLKANLKIAGLKEEDVTIIPVGAGARAAAALSSDQIDAVDSYSDSFTVMAQNGVELDLLERPDEMEKLFSVTMATSQKMLDNDPELLTKFARSAYKGMVYAQLYPESALTLSYKEFPDLAGSEDPKGQEAKNTLEAMKVALADSTPEGEDDPNKWGQWLNIGNDRWQSLLDFAYETGQIENEMTPSQVWDGSLMDAIYSFDSSDIKQK